MLAKLLLPKLGGSPSVWAVSMCFFQGALLLGYCYAFLMNRLARARSAVVLHVLLLAVSCLALPVALPSDAVIHFTDGSYLSIIAVLAMAAGLPFIGVAANAPLLQSWFARTTHHEAHEPYVLYRASNAGSLVALIAYPVLFEPMLALPMQAAVWSVGFLLLGLTIALCGILMLIGWRGPASVHSERSEVACNDAAPVGWRMRLAWTGLAFVPAGLLVAFTTYLTTDIASAPFLWVVPLAIYLGTFIVVFRPSQLRGERFLETIQPLVVAVAILSQVDFARAMGLPALSAIGLVAFVTTCLVCHRRLYLQRPAAAQLTEFYLWMSLGGVLGGIFAAIVAPQIFSSAIEYPLLLALGLAWRLRARKCWVGQPAVVDIGLGIVAVAALGVALVWGGDPSSQVRLIGLSLIAALVVARLGPEPVMGLQLALITLIAALVAMAPSQRSDYSARSFFGVHRVTTEGDFRLLLHGTTLHGAQRVRTVEGSTLDADKPPPATTYFHPDSGFVVGLGLMRASFRDRERSPAVGIVGLGTGAMACHASPGERWRFFEIDPAVVDIAKNPRLFNYLSNCMNDANIVMGDARITLSQTEEGSFDYLLIDAFNSDAIPVHLLTVEALQLYLAKLSDYGVLALHISNRHLDLVSVVGANIDALPGVGAILIHKRSVGTRKFDLDVLPSQVVLVARHGEVLAPARRRADALPLVSTGVSPWTDDFQNIASALMRGHFIGRGHR